MSDIVLYKKQKLERIHGKELVPRGILKQKLPRFFIASSVYVGKYNQAGFVIVDRNPDKRPFWTGSDIIRYSPDQVEREIEQHKKYGVGIPEEKRYFYDTTGGMAALRYFAISDELMDILRKDYFLGPAMIRKICEEAAVPEDFDEIPVCPPDIREPIWEYNDEDAMEKNGLKTVIDQALLPLKERTGADYVSQEYVTYFPPAAYPLIVSTLEESVRDVVARFDQFGDKFNLLETHKGKLARNPILLE